MAYFNNYNQGEVQQSKYNSAMLKISRLNESWVSCRKYLREGDFISLNDELRLIWLELFADATDGEKKEMKSFRAKYRELLINNYLDPRARKQKIFELLTTMWAFLTMIEKQQGLGKAYINPDEDSWFK